MERLHVCPDQEYRPFELAIHMARYLPVRGLVQGARVLDIACGEGYASYGMQAHWGARQVVGIDVDRTAVLAARRMFGHDQALTFNCNDAVVALGRLRGGFDVAVSVETIEHVNEPRALLKGLGRAVGKRGAIYVTCPNDHWYYGPGSSLNPHHKHVFTFDAFRDLAESVLGPAAEWYLGSRVDGFATTPVGAVATADDWRSGLDAGFASGGRMAAAPITGGHEMSAKNSLFYAGLWIRGRPDLVSAGTSAAVLLSDPAHQRQPMLGFPAALRGERPFATTIIAPEGHLALEVYKEIAADLGERAVVRLQPYAPGKAAPAIVRALAAPPDHLCLVGRQAAAAFFLGKSLTRGLLKRAAAKHSWRSVATVMAAPVLTTWTANSEQRELGPDWDTVRSLSDQIWTDTTHPGMARLHGGGVSHRWLTQISTALGRADILRPARRAFFQERLLSQAKATNSRLIARETK